MRCKCRLLATRSFSAGQSDVARLVAALKVCRDLDKVRRIHDDAARRRLDADVYVANTLLTMYARHGAMVDAQRVFDRMPRPDVVSWNSLILGYASNGYGGMALDLFGSMQRKGCVPNARTFVAALKACSTLAGQEPCRGFGDGKSIKIGALSKGLTIYEQAMATGAGSDIFVPNAALDLFAKCGSLDEARRVFDAMKQRDVVTWNSIVVGYGDNGDSDSALKLFGEMIARGCKPNARSFVASLKACTNLAAKEDPARLPGGKEVKILSLERGMSIHSQAAASGLDVEFFVANTLVDFYVKCGSSADARRIFDKMPLHDVVSWTALVLGYAENGEGRIALDLFECMQREGCLANARTFVAALKACCGIVAVAYVKALHAEIYKLGFDSDVVLSNCVVDSYGKCGSVEDANRIFDTIGNANSVAWTSMITGYSSQGDAEKAFEFFRMMRDEGLQPNAITFVSLLTACSYAGLIKQGRYYFEMMSSEYGLSPGIQNYTCMVDILSRSNELDEAVRMLQSMPVEADAVIWRTVLSSCRKWKNVEVAKLAFDALVKLESSDPSAYMLMGSIYGSRGMWEEQRRVESMRTRARAWKKFEPAQSWWIDPSGRVHSFLVGGEKNHPQREEIQAKLISLVAKMKELGYVPDFGSLHNVNSGSSRSSCEEKEEALCGHSERLAIACALINSASGSVIRVSKNLRVCEDCHRAIGLISLIEQRVIVCRDASRFHSYKSGVCSCNNHW